MESNPTEADTGSAKVQGLTWFCRMSAEDGNVDMRLFEVSVLLAARLTASQVFDD
jgi:hypothetical protein